MKKSLGITLALSLGLLSANVALANDAVLGALLGGGAGAIVGRSIGGRDGTIIGGALGAAAGAAIGSEQSRHRVDYYPQPPVYYPQQVYYTQPLRIVQPPVYYIRRGYDGDDRRHHDHHDWDRRNLGRGWGDHH